MRSFRRIMQSLEHMGMVLCLLVGGCDVMQELLGGQSTDAPAGDVLPAVAADSVLLLLENRSGEVVTVEAAFQYRDQPVRRTIRLLPPSGPESQAELIRTVAEQITVVARVAGDLPFLGSSRLKAGFLLAERGYRLRSDYQAGDTIRFVVPAAPSDCNENGVPDDEDLASGSSIDCNQNGRPDECDIALGISADANTDGVPDECEVPAPTYLICPGYVEVAADQDCVGHVPDLSGSVEVQQPGGGAGSVLITQNPAAGTAFVGSVEVDVLVSSGAGAAGSCTVLVAAVDKTAPGMSVPEDAAVECEESVDPAVNPMLGFAGAADNCDPSPLITYTDEVLDESTCAGLVARTWTARDAAGNASSGTQWISMVDRRPPLLICPPDVIAGSCGVPSPSQTGWATATDDCDACPSISYLDWLERDQQGRVHIARIWTAIDMCGNWSSCRQNITLMEILPGPLEDWTKLQGGAGPIPLSGLDGGSPGGS
jgi:hypothetical protein